MEKSYKRILLLGIGFILCGTLASQEQKQDSTEGKNNIKASEYLMPKRKGAEKFHSKRGSEHLFFSVGSGIGYLFNVGGGQTAHGPRASFMAGNWLTPVIGLRAGGEYTQWKQGDTDMHLAGANVDYLINISAFAARYNPKRVFEVIGALGLSYQATIVKDQKTIHSYGLRAGLQGKLNVSSAFNLFIEPQLALYPDRVDNQSSWKRYNLAGSLMAGITYKPAGYATLTFLKGGFASLAAGTGNTGNVLFDTEFALGKWFDKFNGMRISAGSSTAFLDNEDSSSNRDFNISLNIDYLCSLTRLFSDRDSHVFNLIVAGGIGSYFPGAESSSSIILNGRIGLQGEIRLSAHSGLWLEPRINIFKDRSYRADLQEPIRGTVGLMVGTTYKF